MTAIADRITQSALGYSVDQVLDMLRTTPKCKLLAERIHDSRRLLDQYQEVLQSRINSVGPVRSDDLANLLAQRNSAEEVLRALSDVACEVLDIWDGD